METQYPVNNRVPDRIHADDPRRTKVSATHNINLAGGYCLRVRAGPYRGRIIEGPGLCLAAELQDSQSIVVDTPDFGVPSTFDMYWGLYRFVRRGEGLIGYVGCRGGIGRTGMAMALLFKLDPANADADPVDLVRQKYLGYAIETQKQEAFVRAFPIRLLKLHLRVTKSLTWW